MNDGKCIVHVMNECALQQLTEITVQGACEANNSRAIPKEGDIVTAKIKLRTPTGKDSEDSLTTVRFAFVSKLLDNLNKGRHRNTTVHHALSKHIKVLRQVHGTFGLYCYM